MIELIPSLARVQGLSGLALKGVVTQETLSMVAGDRNGIYEKIYKLADKIISALSLGRYHRDLPIDVRSNVAMEAFGPGEFYSWLESRKVFTLDETNEAGRKLRNDLGL